MRNIIVIGAGAMGIFITLELLHNGDKVTLVTDKSLNNSVSYKYAVGVNTELALIDPALMRIDDPLWFVRCIMMMEHKMKKKLYRKSIDMLQRYGINSIDCDGTEFLYAHKVLDKIIKEEFPRYSERLTIKENTRIKFNEIRDLSKEYDVVYVTIGSGKRHAYTKNILGFRVLIESETYPDCLNNEKGLMISSIEIDGKKYTHVVGGVISGGKKYDQMQNLDFHDLDTKLVEMSFWEKYGCRKITSIETGRRAVSIDGLPFHYNRGNVTYIEGGSFMGFVLSPLYAFNIVNKIKEPGIDFSIERLNKKTMWFTLVILVLMMGLYHFIGKSKNK